LLCKAKTTILWNYNVNIISISQLASIFSRLLCTEHFLFDKDFFISSNSRNSFIIDWYALVSSSL
jgi:hypothetical protein